MYEKKTIINLLMYDIEDLALIEKKLSKIIIAFSIIAHEYYNAT